MVRRLHWIPVGSCIHFKINLITFNAIAHQQPPSLWNILEHVPQGLHSARATCLVRPYVGGFGTHAFANYAHKLWNFLPVSIHWAGSVAAFRKALKTQYLTIPLECHNFTTITVPCLWSQHHPAIELDHPRL